MPTIHPAADRPKQSGLAELDELPAGGPDAVPLTSLTVDLTHRCVFRCPGCIEAQAMRHSRFSELRTVTVRNLINTFADRKGKEVLLYGGEPTAHPDFPDLLSFAARRVGTVRVVTNGALLGEPRVNQAFVAASRSAHVAVRVSLNAGSAATHGQVHRTVGFFKTVIQGMSLLTRGQSKVELGISFLVEDANATEVEQAYQIAEEVGARYLWLRPKTGLHGIGLLPLTAASRQALLTAWHRLGRARPPAGPELQIEPWYLQFLRQGVEPDTTKPYPSCYYCAACRLVVTPPDPGVAWACTYWRGHPAFHVANLAEAPFGSTEFERRRQEAIHRIRPGRHCAGVICNRHEANLAIHRHLRTVAGAGA